MTTSLGNAAFVLSADASGLSKGLDQADKDISQFTALAKRHVAEVDSRLSRMGQSAGKGLASSLSSLRTIAGPAAMAAGIGLAMGTAVVGGFSAVVVGGASKVWGDALDKMIALNSSGKIAEAFRMNKVEWQKMMGGFMWAGNTDPSEFIESQGSISSITQNALDRTPEAVKAFKELNIQVEQFAKLSQDRRYWTLVNALATYKGDAVGLAGKFFGTDGTKRMMPLIGKTEAEINKLSVAFQYTAGQIAAAEISTQKWQQTTALVRKEYDSLLLSMGPLVAVVSAVGKDMLGQFQQNFGGIDFGKVAVEGAYAFGLLVDNGKAFAKEFGPVLLNAIDNFADCIEAVSLLDRTFVAMGMNSSSVWNNLARTAFPVITTMIDLSKAAADANTVTPSESPVARRIKEATAASRRFLDTLNTTDPTATANRYGRLAQTAVDSYQNELQRKSQEIKNKKGVAPEVSMGDGGAAEAAAAGAFGFAVAEEQAERVAKLQQQQLRELRRQWDGLEKQVGSSSLGEMIQAGTSGQWKLAARVEFDRSGNRAEDEHRELLRRQLAALEKLVEKPTLQLGVF